MCSSVLEGRAEPVGQGALWVKPRVSEKASPQLDFVIRNKTFFIMLSQ